MVFRASLHTVGKKASRPLLGTDTWSLIVTLLSYTVSCNQVI